MDVFLKISVLQANFCRLEDVLGREVLLGKRQFRVRQSMSRIAGMCSL